MTAWFRSASGVLALAALAGAACSRPRAASDNADVPAVAVAKVVRGDIAQSLTIAAEFRPFQEIEVHAKVAGFLKSISVDVGDRVKAGQLLAVLEIPELQDEIRQDEASVKRAGEEISRAQADLERAQSAHEVAHLTPTRLAGVMKTRPNLVAQQDIDEATGRDRVAEAQVSTAAGGAGVGAGAARDRKGRRRARRRRCSTTRESPRRSPASSRIATQTPAR